MSEEEHDVRPATPRGDSPTAPMAGTEAASPLLHAVTLDAPEHPAADFAEDRDDELHLLGAEPVTNVPSAREGEVMMLDDRSASPGLCPPDVTLQDLFGDFTPLDHDPIDPTEWDAEAVVHEAFGLAVTEMDVFHDFHLETDADDHRDAIIASFKREEELQPCIDIFGDVWDFLSADLATGVFEHPSIASCQLPPDPLAELRSKDPLNEAWLLDMCILNPNRQTLHVEEEPFDPRVFKPPVNTERRFYTPQNTIRWVKGKDGKTLSNARVVRWSDGSATLHIGCDVYELMSNREHNLSIVAKKAQFREESSGSKHEAWVEAIQFERHVVAVPASGVPNSVNEALIIEAARNKKPASELVPFLQNPLPTMRTPKELNKTSELAPAEEFIAMLRDQRRRKIEDAAREGNPFAPQDIIRMELEDLQLVAQAVQEATLPELIRDQRAHVEQQQRLQQLRTATRNAARQVVGRKYDRSTTLQHLDGSGEAYVDASSAINEPETDASNFIGTLDDNYILATDSPDVPQNPMRRPRSQTSDSSSEDGGLQHLLVRPQPAAPS